MGLMKIGKSLMSSLFTSPETSTYPKGGLQLPELARGLVSIEESMCTLCGLCERRCPAGAIKTDRFGGELFIDRMKCITCGECIDECPAGCLEMLVEYLPPDDSVVIDVFNVRAVPGSDRVLNGIEMPAVEISDLQEMERTRMLLREVQAPLRKRTKSSPRKAKKDRPKHRNKRQK